MKLSELKTKFKNKYVIRIVAGALVIALVATGTSVYSVSAAKQSDKMAETTEETAEAEEADDVEDALDEALNSKLTINEKEIGKEETVYVIADSTGAAQNVIVSDHLINNDDKAVLEDASTLSDIKNVKGDETFTQNGNKLTWQADGNDIFYQGTATAKMPVEQKITYYLNGKEIAAKDLAGKSGKVTIRFDYVNNEKIKTNIGGKEEEICVPFVALSGMVLGDDFSNIEVANGKVVADGNRNVVVGYTLPGLKESLQIKDKDLDSDVKIPEYFEVTANVENFSLDMTMTVVMNATSFVSAEGDNELSSIDDMLDEMTDATVQLEDGSAELADGVDTLKGKLGEFQDGMTTLKDGISAYTQGADTLNSGIGTLKGGIDTLADNVPALVDGVGQLKAGADSAATGAASLADGAAQVSAGVDAMVGTIQGMGTTLEASKTGVYNNFQTTAGMSYEQAQATIQSLQQAQATLAQGVGFDVQAAGYLAQGGTVADPMYQQLAGGAQQCYAGVAAALAGSGINVAIGNASDAAAVIASLGDKIAQLQNGIGQVDGAVAAIDQVKGSLAGGDSVAQLAALQQGAAQVAAGAASLSEGVGALDAGLTKLNDNAGTLSGGVGQLKDGAAQLADGAATLVANNGTLNEGASKLSDGTGAIVDGVGQLNDGAHKLADGIVTFNEEGIQKITDSYSGDLKPLIDRLQAVLDAGESYQSYTDIADGVNGTV